jgi:hypothetical protein
MKTLLALQTAFDKQRRCCITVPDNATRIKDSAEKRNGQPVADRWLPI